MDSVTQQNTAGGTTEVVTNYSYSGAAWHYDDDAVTRSSLRTWDEFRGFRTVTTENGNAANGDPVTQETDTYFQGMNGDYQGAGNAVTSASLTSLVGNVTVTDSRQFAGTEFEKTVYDGAGSGSTVTDTVSTPWSSAATATQSQPSPLPALTAYLTGTAKTQAFTALASGGYREADVSYAHDSLGRVTSAASAPDAFDDGAAGDATEDTCTQTSYPPSGTILTLPEEVIITSVAPANCPVSGLPTQPELVSDTRYFYDGATSITTAPTKGNVTETETATSYNSSDAEVFTPQSEDTYDEYGRVLTELDANAIAAIANKETGAAVNPTTTAYTPATGAEPTSVTVTDPMKLGSGTVATYDPARDLPLTETSAAGLVTTETYDALGRLTAVWTPGHPTSGPADKTFSYSVSNKNPSVTTTNTIDVAGNYQVSEVLYDSLGRQIETQTQTADGKRDITDTYYQSDGWVQDISNPYYTTGAPSATLVAAADDEVPSQIGYVYDGAGRVTRQIAYSLAAEEYETDTSYGGDYTTVTPPSGGTATTTYVNGIGKPSYVFQYHAATPPATPPAPGSGSRTDTVTFSGWDQTAYAYTPAGQLATITDATGKNTWSYGYDLLGRQTSASDPDAGNTTSSYDGNGNLLAVIQSGVGAKGSTTTSYAYDADNRKTAEYDTTGGASETTSDEVAAWTYDTLAAGEPYQSISYVGGISGTAYKESVTGYNAYGLPQGTQLQVTAGTWAGTYKELYSYSSYADEMTDVTYPAAGGLPEEDVTTGFDAADEPASLGSSLWTYVAALAYTELGQPQEYALGTTTEPAWVYNTYDEATNRLDSSEVQAAVTPVTVDATSYTYDNAGLITAEADTPSGGPAQVQCFQYDYVGRLTAAWSQGSMPSTGCGTAGPNGGSSTQASEASAAAPYWNQYGYDLSGDLTSVTSTTASGNSTTTQSDFPASGATAHQPSGSTTPPSPPHAVTGTGPAGFTTPSTAYAYDQAGRLTSITGSGPDQQLSWNDQGQLASVTTTSGSNAGTTSYVYDASGNLLTQTDGAAGTATLYLPGETLTETTSGTTAYSSTRYYTIGGVTIAARSSSGAIDYLAGNQQGTATVAIDSASLLATYRYYDPYGNPVAPAGTATAWPGGTRGFVGGTADPATGLTNLGAREYNPATSSFVSPDPLLDPNQPQDLNGYAYSLDDPVNFADPTGANPNPPPCEMLGDCSTALPPPGVAAPGAPNSSDPSGGNDGSGYTNLGPGVKVQNNDPRLPVLRHMYYSYLQFNGFNPARIVPGQNDAIWLLICQQSPGLCPSGMYITLMRMFVPGGTGTSPVAAGVFFLGGGGGAFGGGASGGGSSVFRSLADPESMVGASLDELRALVPQGWIERPLGTGTGIRFLAPGRNPGTRGWIEFNEGAPGVGDPLHAGPYMRLSVGGFQYRAALAGNPVLEDPAISNLQIIRQGSTGPIDLTVTPGADDGGTGGADDGGGAAGE